jgi:hypothetical protein
LGDARLDGGAGRLAVGFDVNAVFAGFFLPQLSQSLLGILKALLVEHPGNETAEIEKMTAKTSVVRRRLFRMANASLSVGPQENIVAPGACSVSMPAAVHRGPK